MEKIFYILKRKFISYIKKYEEALTIFFLIKNWNLYIYTRIFLSEYIRIRTIYIYI